MPAETDEDRDWIDPTTWPAAAAHPEAVRTLTAALAQVLTPYAREHGTAKSFAALAVESLALSGRLLPDGGETRTEWLARWGEDLEFEHPVSGKAYAAGFVDSMTRGGFRAVTARREVREWPDGSSWSGPWVDPENTKED